MIRRFIKDSIVYMVPSILNRGISIILVPLYTRVISPADYGAFDLIMMFFAAVATFASLQISSGAQRFCTAERDPDKRADYSSAGLWFTILTMGLFAMIYLIWGNSLSAVIFGREGFASVFRLGAVQFTISSINTYAQDQFRRDLRSIPYTVASIINMFVTAFVSVLLSYVMGMGLAGLITGIACGSAASLIYSLFMCRGRAFRLSFSYPALREMLSFSFPLVPAAIFGFASAYIGRFIINYYLTLTDLGLYGIANKLAALTSLVMVGFSSALDPLIYTYYLDEDTPRQVGVIFRLFCAAAISMFAFLALYSREILLFFTTPRYYPAYKIAFFMIPAVLVSQLSFFAPGMRIAKKTRLSMYIGLFGALLNTALAFALIPRFGTIGAAISALLGNLTVAVISCAVSDRYYPIALEWRPSLIPLFLAVLMIAAAYSLPLGLYSGMALKALMLVAVVASFPISGLIKKHEIARAFAILSSYKSKR